MRVQATADAKRFVRQTDSGVVSTISVNQAGYPFGSVTPYMTDSKGNVYFYISDIAQHARNMQQDSKMSLTIYNQVDSGDQNTQARVTIVGDATPLEGYEAQESLERYVARFPEAAGYTKAHDFQMWKVDVKRVRYIGGFGKIFWLERDEWLANDAPWDFAAEQGMIKHMNEDHVDAMNLILKHHFNVDTESSVMTGVLSDGCYLMADEKTYFVPFSNECVESQDVRKELVKLTHDARDAIAA